MTSDFQHRIIFVSGLSGAGKSVVLHTLEDLGFHCIDNFPIKLLENFFGDIDEYTDQIAFGINARNQETMISKLREIIDQPDNKNIKLELIFLEADNDVLTKRYSETRRKHPFSGDNLSLHDAIKKERELLAELAESADLKIDTSHLNVHDLRNLISQRVAGRVSSSLSIQLISFGYKHGTPHDADFIFDVRCLPNPYWEKSLRNFSGKDREVIDYLDKQPLAEKMSIQLAAFVSEWLDYFEAENRSYLTIGVGCTGGRHRSVYIVEKLAGALSKSRNRLIVTHRDL